MPGSTFCIFRAPNVPERMITNMLNQHFHHTFGQVGASLDPKITEFSPHHRAYDKNRGQYVSDTLLDQCKTQMPSDASKERKYFLYFISDDLYHHDMNFILGQGSFGHGAVISSNRLYGDETLLWRLTAHETGHVFHLSHCQKDPKCVMTYSNSVQELTQTGSDFCHDCKKKLQQALND